MTDIESLSEFTIMADTSYVAAEYVPPPLVLRVSKFVELVVLGNPPVDGEAQNSILAFVSGDRTTQLEYIEGLVGVGAFLCALVGIWFLALLMIKCQGRERMGCAAGYAFLDPEIEIRKRNARLRRKRRRQDDDSSVGAAVDDNDSVAKDNQPRKSKQKESSSTKRSSLFSLFSQASENKAAKETISKPRPPPAPAYITAVPNNYIYGSRNLGEEIELHMEPDDISKLTDPNTSNYYHPNDRVWSLHSIPKKTSSKRRPKTVRIGDESESSSTSDETNRTSRSKFHRTINRQKEALGDSCLCSPLPQHVQRRRTQTRFVFALFAIVSLVSCAMLIIHTYQPLESALYTSGSVIQETTNIIDDLNEVLEVLDETTQATIALAQTTPLNYAALCPGVSAQNFQVQFGFNPQTMIDTVANEYRTYIPTIRSALQTAKVTGDSVTDILVDIDDAVGTTNEYLWVIPLVICVTMLIIFSQLALMCAVVFREQRFKHQPLPVPPKVEDCYAWTVLPLQTVVTLVSWILVIAFCFGMTVTTDSCLPSLGTPQTVINFGEARGTPDDVVLSILDQYLPSTGINTNSDIAKDRLSTYINGCVDGEDENDPLAEVIVVQKLLQETITRVNTQLVVASDPQGLGFIETQCRSQRVRPFLENLTVLNQKFAEVNAAILQGYEALACPRVHALYTDVVYDAFCTDFATANANGLILLFVISFSGMVLITLRASWRSTE